MIRTFRFGTLCLLAILFAIPANAAVVKTLETPEDSGVATIGLNRFFIFNGWSKDINLVASDGNVHAGLTLDPNDPGFNQGNNGAGPSWQIELADYETALGGTLGTGNAIRFSTWINTPASDPLVNQGTWTESIKFEFNQDVSTELFERGTDEGGAMFPSNCDVGTGVCVDPGQVVAGDWALVSGSYVLEAGDDMTNVAIVEPVLFIGDFTSSETEFGTLYLDNMMVEVFADEAAMMATANPNPHPGGIVPEPGSALMLLMAVGGLLLGRRS